MITYHGTTNLILTKRSITSLQSGAFRCNAQYVCRNTDNLEFIERLVRGNRMPELNIFTIGDEVAFDIGSNGFTTFSVVGYAVNAVIDELNPLDTSQQKKYF
jgi:hypothetical protein